MAEKHNANKTLLATTTPYVKSSFLYVVNVIEYTSSSSDPANDIAAELAILPKICPNINCFNVTLVNDNKYDTNPIGKNGHNRNENVSYFHFHFSIFLIFTKQTKQCNQNQLKLNMQTQNNQTKTNAIQYKNIPNHQNLEWIDPTIEIFHVLTTNDNKRHDTMFFQ